MYRLPPSGTPLPGRVTSCHPADVGAGGETGVGVGGDEDPLQPATVVRAAPVMSAEVTCRTGARRCQRQGQDQRFQAECMGGCGKSIRVGHERLLRRPGRRWRRQDADNADGQTGRVMARAFALRQAGWPFGPPWRASGIDSAGALCPERCRIPPLHYYITQSGGIRRASVPERRRSLRHKPLLLEGLLRLLDDLAHLLAGNQAHVLQRQQRLDDLVGGCLVGVHDPVAVQIGVACNCPGKPH